MNAATFSFTGTFDQDDDIRLFDVDLGTSSTLTLLTYSYGGGTNFSGESIPAGGFQPIISLFASSGALLDVSGINGQCPPQTADASTGLCVDAFVEQTSLAAGSYTVALTQFFNVPVGPSLSDGFLQSGTGNFTGGSCGEPGGSFFDETCNQRTNSFALDIQGADSAVVIPEPGSLWLILPAAAMLAATRFRRLRRS